MGFRLRLAWRVLRGRPVMVGMTIFAEGEVYVLKQKGMFVANNRFQVDIQQPPQPREAFVSFSEMVMRFK
jgi:hypothetical protein